MPAQPKHDTLSRLLELLKALPHHRWATPSDLRDLLADRGFDVDLRSVQRDLKELQKHFPLDHNDKGRPHGWRWSVEAAGGIASMSTPEALMLVLVQQHLQAALPATMLEGFESLFARARQRLERLGPRAGAGRWPQKVKSVPPGLANLPPAVDPMVQKVMSDALLSERQIDVLYAPGPHGSPKTYRLRPLGLLLRGGTTYLAAARESTDAVSLYALHRVRSVAMRLESTGFPPGFDMEAALKRGRGQFGVAIAGAAELKLVIACDPVLGGLVAEAPLSSDQRVSPMADGRVEIRTCIPDSWELRWWILGRGHSVEVIRPAALRREIAKAHLEAAARYGTA